VSITANVEEIIRLDHLLEEIAGKPVVSLADLNEWRWLKQQRRYQVRAIRNYTPPSSSIR
jgi:hypothetical protein